MNKGKKETAIVWMLVIWSFLTGFAPLNAGSARTVETTYITGENSPIPFKLLRNKIIVPVRVNNSRELNIILDTGMPSDGLLLFDKNLADELELVGAKRFRISGEKEISVVRFHNHQLGHSDIIHHGFEDTSGLPPPFLVHYILNEAVFTASQ